MEVNLREVIKYNKRCLQDKTLLRNIISDKYPHKIGEMNVLLNVYDIGVIRDIARNGSITELQYSSYVQRLISTYGLQEQLAIQGLNAWIDVFLGTGYSAKFTDASKVVSSNEIQKVIGNIDDYELTMLSSTMAEIDWFARRYLVNTVVVPTEINGIRIVGIGAHAYVSDSAIESLMISDGIEYIKGGACSNCKCLEKVTFPKSLTKLGTKGGNFLGNGVFEKCVSLHSVHLNEGLTEIGEDSFKECTSLLEIVIPSTVKNVERSAFARCKKLYSVHLNEGLTEIRAAVFLGCESLSEITVPNTVTLIGANAFSDCKKLRTVHLNEGLIEIEGCAFLGCKNLSEITIPSTVTKIGWEAFKGCEKLRTVNLNEGLTEIGDFAFEDCESLSEIKIPSTVTRIGAHAFSGLNITVRIYSSLDWRCLEKNVKVEVMKG